MKKNINPFAIKVWKFLWLTTRYGSFQPKFTNEDYFLIEEIGDIKLEYVKKILRADRVFIDFCGKKTKDRLAYTILTSIEKNLPVKFDNFTWKEFTKLLDWHELYKFCENLNLSSYSAYDLSLQKRISIEAKEVVDRLITDFRNQSNVPKIAFSDLLSFVEIAKEEDIEKIYKNAQNRYKCPINGPEIKLPWWRMNNNIFYVIKDNQDQVISNMNLLPLRENCYKKLKQGIIKENEISADDVYTLDQIDDVKHIYVEGFCCTKEYHVIHFIRSFFEILSCIANTNNEIVVGAVAGSSDGSDLMKGLGFKVTTFAKFRNDNMDFYEIATDVAQRIINRRWLKHIPR